METAMVYLKSIGELFAVLPHKWSFSLGLDPARVELESMSESI